MNTSFYDNMRIILLLFFLLITDSWCKSIPGEAQKEKDWWTGAVIYQIYPRSFKDADNDGIGDIRGILEKMDHLVDFDAIWLSPIFQSPMVDAGYDISDYRAIAPEYGTLDDFKDLVEKAHSHGVKVILDFVPNHSSDQHVWFNKSVNREEGYEDYYLWADAKTDENGERVPPNNWISVWRNSGWTWNEKRQQYYFHQFSDKQPDLNYRSTRVRQEMKDILKYWLDMGVDGFRIDAVPHIYEDLQLRDEPVDPNNDGDTNSYSYLQHIYTKDQQETYELVYSWREFLDNYTATEGGSTRIIMTECATDLEKVVRYYGNEDGTVRGAHFSFNFDLLGMNEDSRPADIKNSITRWTNALPSTYTLNWLTGNHDNRRVASRVGTRNIDGYNMLLFFLPGVTVTYMAEEIGQEDGEVTCEEGQDPSAIGNCTTFGEVSRDFERTPFQWDSTINAGFNTGAKPWLPVSSKYQQTNLALQNKTEDLRSHYNIYKYNLGFKSLYMLWSLYRIDEFHPDVLHIARYRSSSNYELIFIFNMGNETRTVPIKKMYMTETFRVFSRSANSQYSPGDNIENNQVVLGAGDSLIVTNY